jgi:hypothetical protein
MSDELIMEIANNVRRRFDKGDVNSPLYCQCAVVSAELSQELAIHQIKHYIAYIDSHCGGHVYIRIGDKLLDLTARQFSEYYPSIVYDSVSNLTKEWFWFETNTAGMHGIIRRFESAADLVQAQADWGWPASQINQRIRKEIGV